MNTPIEIDNQPSDPEALPAREGRAAIESILSATIETAEESHLSVYPTHETWTEAEKINQQEALLIESLRRHIAYHQKLRPQKTVAYYTKQAQKGELYMRKKYPDPKSWLAGWKTPEQAQEYYGPAKGQYTFWLETLAVMYRHFLTANNALLPPWDRRDRRHLTKIKYLIIGLYLHGLDSTELRAELHNEQVKAAPAKLSTKK